MPRQRLILPTKEARGRGAAEILLPELGLDPEMRFFHFDRRSLWQRACDLVAETEAPRVVSFHFGLQNPDSSGRVKGVGAKILFIGDLRERGDLAGTRGCVHHCPRPRSRRPSLNVSLGQCRDTAGDRDCAPAWRMRLVWVPVIAIEGGSSDERGNFAADFMLGASGVQMGTAYLFCARANVSLSPAGV